VSVQDQSTPGHGRHARGGCGQVAAAGAFVRDSQTGLPAESQFWDGEGAHLDFTNPAAVQWCDVVSLSAGEGGVGSPAPAKVFAAAGGVMEPPGRVPRT
jgi:hypothetical protein